MPFKVTKKDRMSEQYRPPTTIELLSKLAEEVPYGTNIYGYPKRGESEPGLKEPLYDPIPQPPIGKVAKLAISLPFAIKQIRKIPQAGLSALQRQEVEDTLKILAATPKRALQSVSDLVVEKPETFKDAAALFGSWGRKGREVTVSPLIASEKLPDTFKTMLQRIEKRGTKYNLPETVSHEFGHEITERLLQKRGKGLFTTPTNWSTYHQNVGLWEGIAEYLGKGLAGKAKVPYTPKFSYGPEQELIFNVLEKAPSKNPYMNVFRFLEKEGTLKRRPSAVEVAIRPEGGMVREVAGTEPPKFKSALGESFWNPKPPGVRTKADKLTDKIANLEERLAKTENETVMGKLEKQIEKLSKQLESIE